MCIVRNGPQLMVISAVMVWFISQVVVSWWSGWSKGDSHTKSFVERGQCDRGQLSSVDFTALLWIS